MGVTWKTGACARDGGHNNALATTRQMTGSRITRVWMRGAFLSTFQGLSACGAKRAYRPSEVFIGTLIHNEERGRGTGCSTD